MTEVPQFQSTGTPTGFAAGTGVAGQAPPGATADPRAVVGRRIVAALLDLLVLTVVASLLAVVFGGASAGGGEIGFQLSGAPALLMFVVGFGYYIVLEGMRGQTLGKMALGIKVLRADGGPAGWGAVVGRNLLRIVDGFFFYLVGLIVMLATQRKQRVGDVAAKTIVVRA